MALLSYRFDLGVRAWIFHAILAAVGVSILSMLARSATKAAWGLVVWRALFSIGALGLLWLYVIFYVALANWGLPLHYKMAYRQLPELPHIMETLPVSPWLCVLSIVLMSVTWMVLLSHGMQRWWAQLRESTGRYTTILLLAPVLLLGIVLRVYPGWQYFADRFPIYRDPVLAFAFAEDVHSGHIFYGFGQEHVASYAAYPENQIKNRPNVILIICDALRADHLGAYGYERPVTPFLDSLAGLETTFAHPAYYSVASTSFVGITASLTGNGLLTAQHFPLHDLLRLQGYTSVFRLAGDFTNFYRLNEYLAGTVADYEDGYTFSQNGGPSLSTADDRLLTEYWLPALPGAAREMPYFLYLHFMTAHQLGAVEEKFREYRPDRYRPGGNRAEALINDYDNRLIQLDTRLRKTVRQLKNKGYLDNALLVITSDHGQALFEDKRIWHGKSTAPYETHIPLLIHATGPTVLPPLSTEPRLHDQSDLSPTIVDILKLAPVDTWEGTSMFADPAAAPVYQHQRDDYSVILQQQGVRWQLTRSRNDTTLRVLQLSPSDSTIAPPVFSIDWSARIAARYRLDEQVSGSK